MAENPIIYAHRGIMKDNPENTAASFEAARRSPHANGAEGDFQRTKEERVVMLHGDLGRTTNVREVFPNYAELPTIPAQLFDLPQLKQLDAGEGEQILTVEELADQFPTTKADPFHIAYEIKADYTAGQIYATAARRGPLKHSIFIGFDPQYMDEMQDIAEKQRKKVQTYRLFRPGDTIPLLTERRHGIGVRIDDCPNKLLGKAQRYKVPVLGYSPMIEPEGFPEDVARLYRHPQVTGLILNDPDQLPNFLGEERA